MGAFGAHISFAKLLFCHIALMNNDWSEIIAEALRLHVEKTNAAVPGAKLRAAVAEVAKSRGLNFPPSEMGKFSSFVESFQTEFIVDRPPGGDILVVPASRPELLAATNSISASNRARVRQDLFEALTRIPSDSFGLPYYDLSTDAVIYLKQNEATPARYLSLPATSLEKELQIRLQFIVNTDMDETPRQALQEVVTKGTTPLREFSQTVQSFGLGQQWHIFRMSLLATILRTWSVENAVPWQQSWVRASEQRATYSPVIVPPVSVDVKKQLIELAAMLSEGDLSRISVPMDIVLRLISKK